MHDLALQYTDALEVQVNPRLRLVFGDTFKALLGRTQTFLTLRLLNSLRFVAHKLIFKLGTTPHHGVYV